MSLSAVSQSAPDARLSWWHDLRASLRENSLLVLFSVCFGLVPFIVARQAAIPHPPYDRLWLSYVGFFLTVGIAIFGAFALWYLYHARVRKVPNFQIVAWHRIRTDFLHRDRIFLALPIFAMWPVTASAFSYLKSVMPLVQPFYLDPWLHQWDRTVHLGVDPWRLMQPFLGYRWITYLINFVYSLWFFVLQAMLILQAGASGNRKRRMQFLLTMALSWALIGNLAATFMSSSGPCYFGLVYSGPDPYAPLMRYLHEVAGNLSWQGFGHELRLPLTALIMQDMLWQGYLAQDFGIAKGISAAPSMHIASTWIIWRLAWSMGWTARIFGTAFLAFIFVGSIHLGWHYALDGYLAATAAWLLWRFTGCLLEWPAIRALLWPERAGTAASPPS